MFNTMSTNKQTFNCFKNLPRHLMYLFNLYLDTDLLQNWWKLMKMLIFLFFPPVFGWNLSPFIRRLARKLEWKVTETFAEQPADVKYRAPVSAFPAIRYRRLINSLCPAQDYPCNGCTYHKADLSPRTGTHAYLGRDREATGRDRFPCDRAMRRCIRPLPQWLLPGIKVRKNAPS